VDYIQLVLGFMLCQCILHRDLRNLNYKREKMITHQFDYPNCFSMRVAFFRLHVHDKLLLCYSDLISPTDLYE